ncbi:hypothetical protein GCM10025771_42200 [Niveibacterium umoris]|uniref:Osmotically-inducible protein OsmY n=1 Tax=Niveibacterium umoris TaxID=1193620 RepID=A0A840BP61_9RHOO|nr:BON domain-containing protein [Niveibacterium umoris]MBB4014780.1 osmotically-inducible protein OsmY [Niveibacterium umoris]
MMIRRILSAAALLLAIQGCVPIVATGVGVGVTATLDRRSYGTQVEDSTIETKGSSAISNKLGPAARVSVTSYNRVVLLSGEVPDAAAKAEAERQLASIPNPARSVHNELVIGPRASFSTQSNDLLITSSVKARLVETKEISSIHVKVVVESGICYLMGMLTPREIEVATYVASTTSGVIRVVRVFETLTPEQAKQLDSAAGVK